MWYFRRKPCTYLAPTITLSPNSPKRVSTWVSSPRSTIGCVQNDFWSCGMFGANRAPILHRHKHYLQTDQNEIPLDHYCLGVPSGASKMISEPIVYLVHIVHLSCVKISTISKHTEWASTWASLTRSTIGCIQNFFWVYGTFGANHAPILHRH
jgi:hypothetical protein